MRFFRFIGFIFAAFWLTLPAEAQDDDKGFITRTLESSLAGEGRAVEINGFAGALSRQATIESIVISDDEGQWLKMSNLILQLNRSALLRGRIEIEELSAQEIDLSRLPIAPEGELPPAEAQGFSLPDLPVSIDVKSLRADRIILGEPILGEKSELRLNAKISLINGEAVTDLVAQRIDAKRGVFDIKASFSSDDEIVNLDVNLSEGEGGIAARLLNIPDQPSVNMSIQGNGPLSNLGTNLKISTDGVERLSGSVSLAAVAPATVGATVSRAFVADVTGDVTALFAPQYRPFFGNDVSLNVEGVRDATGALDISKLALITDALNLEGEVRLNASYWPTYLDVAGSIRNDENTLITLPISSESTQIREAILDLNYDQSTGDTWEGVFQITDLKRSDINVDQATLSLDGIFSESISASKQLTANLDLDAKGVAVPEDALQTAIGDTVTGQLTIQYAETQPIKLSNLNLTGQNYGIQGDITLGDLESGLKTNFDLSLEANDISRFSDLAGSNLAGQVNITAIGEADLGGSFDVMIKGTGSELKAGQEQVDILLNGKTQLSLSATRNQSGTNVRELTLKNPQIELEASGFLTSEGADLELEVELRQSKDFADILDGPASIAGKASQRGGEWSVDFKAFGPFGASAKVKGLATGPTARVEFDTRLPDIKSLAPQYSGAFQLEGSAFQSPEGWRVDTSFDAPYQINGSVVGLATGSSARMKFTANLPDVSPFAAQYRGAANLTGDVFQSPEGWRIDTTLDGPYSLSAELKGRVTGDRAPVLDLQAYLPNIAPLVSNISGPLSIEGKIQQNTPDTWSIDTMLAGPGGTAAKILGSATSDAQLDLSVNGDAPLALANPFISPRTLAGNAFFDLSVVGPAALSSVSGTITTNGAKLSAPTLRVALNAIDAQIALKNARADLNVQAQVSSGGTILVTGPIGLDGQIPANLRIALDTVGIEDPSLYRTTLDGLVSIDGFLVSNARISGEINVGDTLVKIPASGISSFGTIPPIDHIGAPADVRRTLIRAGLDQKSSNERNANGSAYPLDLTINAPQQIFVRGRGLDAELGGQLRLTGNTNNIISAGRFELVRGRLDILEKRFELDEGTIQLQGDFDPFIRFVAVTETATGSASVIVDGPATSPEVRFESSPEAPQDEVLAQIFFGRDVSQISALQALQLANAVATLAGRGGEGIVSKLRRSFSLDDLDITTDEEGNAGLRAGKYISDNIYTDVTVGTQNDAEVSLNIDLSPNITARGSANNAGETSLGIFFEKDY